jgi:hypothetical protein
MGIVYPYVNNSDDENSNLIQNGQIIIRPDRNVVIIRDYSWRFYLTLIGLTLLIFLISILLAFLFNYILYKRI